MFDYNSLSTRQKLNVLGLRIQREYTNRRHGEHVRIATTEEEAAQERGFMALPTTRVAPGKQLYMKMTEVKELPTGGYQTVRTAEQTEDVGLAMDMLDALEQEEMKLYGDSSIVLKSGKKVIEERPEIKPAMPEMPAMDKLEAIENAAISVLSDMEADFEPTYTVGKTVTAPKARNTSMSDSDFIKALLAK